MDIFGETSSAIRVSLWGFLYCPFEMVLKIYIKSVDNLGKQILDRGFESFKERSDAFLK